VSSAHQPDGFIAADENMIEERDGCVVIYFDNNLKEKKQHIQGLRKLQNQRAKENRQARR
jgi:hypothetical protein